MASSSSAEMPESFLDPNTFDAMSDPVFTCDGHTYDRASITRWLDTHTTSPRTGLVLDSFELRPNHALRQAIEEWYSAQGTGWQIPWAEVEIGERLGSGAFKTVWSGSWKGRQVALLQLRGGECCAVECQVMHELGRHPRLASFYGMTQDGDGVKYMVMEIAHHGSLDAALPRLLGGVRPTPQLVVAIGEQVAEAMECIALRGIIHRDLAARNVLACDLTLDGRRLDIRVSDFGLAREQHYVFAGPSDALPVRWMAPEAILQHKFSEKTDVWSFGVLLWELCTLEVPFAYVPDLEQLQRQVCEEGRRLEQPEGCPGSLYSLMMRCWAHAAAERPTFKDLRGMLRELALELHSEVPSEGHAPAWRQFKDGLNFERRCESHTCAAYNQMVIIPCGFGEFDVGRDLPESRCPSCGCCSDGGDAEDERVWLSNCEWSWSGRVSNAPAQVHKDQGRCEGAPFAPATHRQVWRSLTYSARAL